MQIQREGLYTLLVQSNPWWDSGKVPSRLVMPFRRRDFYVLRKEHTSRPITALGGPRQVGKTTILNQLIEQLLAEGVQPKRILYLSLDTPGFLGLTKNPLNDALNLYAEEILGEAWDDVQEPVHVFIDEITRQEGWHRDLKGWFDLRYPIKFIIASSSLSSLRTGAAESLVGRVDIHRLLTWKFVDVLSYTTKDEEWNAVGLRLREAFQKALTKGNVDLFLKGVAGLRTHLTRKRPVLQSVLNRYLLIDGFPELLDVKDLNRCAQRLREYLDLTIVNDLYRVYQVRATGSFENLLTVLAKESGQLISYRGLAENLGTQERTVIEHVDLLSRMLLVSLAYFFSESRAKRVRRQRKVFVSNPSIRNILLNRVSQSTLQDTSYLGPSVEGLVHDHAKRLAFCLNPGQDPEAFYWRDRRGHEVDIVLRIEEKALPIEVKYRGDPYRDLGGLEAFMDQDRSAPFGVVVTRDVLDQKGRLLLIPLSWFLLMV